MRDRFDEIRSASSSRLSVEVSRISEGGNSLKSDSDFENCLRE